MAKDQSTEEKIKTLNDKILYHKALYYRGEPEISDQEYDNLEKRLRELDPESPVLYLVGSEAVKGSVEHVPLMLSCRKAIDGITEVYSWYDKVKDKQIISSYKVDGLSLSLIYEEGHLTLASTRGDGHLGENITANIMKVESIPKTIPYTERINIRGELYMKKSEFNRLKNQMPEMYSSPRNLATGTIKQKNPLESANRELHMMVFDIIGLEDYTYTSEQLDLVASWGFETVVIKILKNPSYNEILQVYNELREKRDELDFEIDGIVYRWDNRKEFIDAGTTAHTPRGQIALKFENQGAATKLKDITWQVSRNGILTPVAELEPVEVAGAKISRATMHNYDFIKINEISIGDIVSVERAGDVIPKITGVVEKLGSNYVAPTNCPSCNEPLSENNVTLVCLNQECPERIKQMISYWVRVVDIKGLGDKNIDKLIKKGYLKSTGDLYSSKLNELNLVSLLGRNGKKIYEEIQNKKVLPLNVLLTGLGIEGVGKSTAKVLVKYFPTLQDLQNAKKEDLLKVEGISDISAEKILNGLKNNSLLQDLMKNGVSIGKPLIVKKKHPKSNLTSFLGLETTKDKSVEKEENQEVNKIISNDEAQINELDLQESKGKVYVTGSVPSISKNEVQEFVEQHGYEWSTSISKKLTYLVIAEKPGQAKIDKALKLGVKVMAWNKFERMLEE